MSRSASFSGVSFFIKTLCGLVLSSLTLQCRVVNCTCFSCLCSSVTSTTLVKSLENTEKPRAEVREEFCHFGTSLVVQWLRLCASNAGDMGSIPGQGTKIPHACRARKKKKKDKPKNRIMLLCSYAPWGQGGDCSSTQVVSLSFSWELCLIHCYVSAPPVPGPEQCLGDLHHSVRAQE